MNFLGKVPIFILECTVQAHVLSKMENGKLFLKTSSKRLKLLDKDFINGPLSIPPQGKLSHGENKYIGGS